LTTHEILSLNQSIKQSVDQSINQPTNQSINQSINQCQQLICRSGELLSVVTLRNPANLGEHYCYNSRRGS